MQNNMKTMSSGLRKWMAAWMTMVILTVLLTVTSLINPYEAYAANSAPTNITLSATSIAENAGTNAVVGTLSATDSGDTSTKTYSLVSGTGSTDISSFNISGTSLRANGSFDFESKSSYAIRLQVRDGGGLTYQKAFTITVTNVNEAPTNISLSGSTIAENSAANTAIGTLSATDPDAGATFTFSLPAGVTDNASFNISGTSLRAPSAFDFETKNSYSVTVRVTDQGSLTFDKLFAITVTNVNEGPTDIVLSADFIFENAGANAVVGTLSATDSDTGDTATFTLVAGTGSTDNASFNISGMSLRANASFDLETKSSYSVRVRVTDSGSLSFEKPFAITVTKPFIYNQDGFGYSGKLTSFSEITNPTMFLLNNWPTDYSKPAGAFWGGVYDGTSIWLIPNNADRLIKVNPSTGEMTGYNTWPSGFTKGVNAFAGGVYDGTNIWLIPHWADRVIKVNASTGEMTGYNSWPSGFTKGTSAFTAGVYDGTNIWMIPHSATHVIKLNVSTGEMTAYNSWPSGFTKGGDAFHGGVYDGTNVWMIPADATHLIKVNTSTGAMTGYNSWPSGFTKGTRAFSGGVYDGTSIWMIPLNADSVLKVNTSTGEMTRYNSWPSGFTKQINAFFGGAYDGTNIWLTPHGNTTTSIIKMNATTGEMTGYNNWPIPVMGSYSNKFRGTVYDGKSFWMIPFTGGDVVRVADNSSPTDIVLSSSSIAENKSPNSTVGTLNTTDTDVGDKFTFTLVSGEGDTDNASFNISSNTTGTILRTSQMFNFEVKSSYSIRLRVTDSGGLTFERQLTVTVTNVNETPTNITLSPASIAENAGANAVVGTLSATDDAGDTATFTLVAGTGSTNNASFNISGTSLRANASFDFETKSSYSVRVRVTDSGSLTFENSFTINVTDVTESTAPTNIILSSSSIAENAGANAVVGTLSATDSDAGDTATFTLVSGSGDTNNDSFNISGTSLRANASFDFETKSSYSVRVRVTDSGSLTFEKSFTINVTDVAENTAPTNIILSSSSIAENAGANAVVGSLSATDADAGDTATFTLVSGSGDTNNSSFNISGTSLRANASFDFETKSSYSIRVRVTDSVGATFEKQFTISVTNVEDAAPSTPTGLATTQVTHNSISFRWNPSTDDVAVVAYNVFRNGLYVASTAGTRFTITGLNPLSSHNITVQAYDAARNRSARSTALSVTTAAPPDSIAPTMPTNVAVSKVSGTSLEVKWTASTDDVGVTGYNVYLNGVVVKTVTNPSTTISGLSNLTAYSIRVQALDAAKNRSVLSAQISATTTDSTAPSAPSNVASTNVTKTGARVTWTAATDNVAVTNYNIYRNGAYVATVSGTTTAYNLSGLTAGTTYSITVRALDAARNFTNSAALSVTTLP